ncbi:putative HET-domain-containing protein [Seiridium cardinale]
MAYCLLGLFGISMPLAYAEGRRAFMRLRAEILNQLDDDSIFAWVRDDDDPSELGGMLAEWPTAFRRYLGIMLRQGRRRTSGPSTLIDKGTEMRTAFDSRDVPINFRMLRLECWTMPLDCFDTGRSDTPGDLTVGKRRMIVVLLRYGTLHYRGIFPHHLYTSYSTSLSEILRAIGQRRHETIHVIQPAWNAPGHVLKIDNLAVQNENSAYTRSWLGNLTGLGMFFVCMTFGLLDNLAFRPAGPVITWPESLVFFLG